MFYVIRSLIKVMLVVLAFMTFMQAKQVFADEALPPVIKMGYFHKYFSGKINNKYSFTMNLKNLNGVLSGTYEYESQRIDIYLSGNISPDGSFSLKELDPNNPNRNGNFFSGNMVANGIAGTWHSFDGIKNWPFKAAQTSEIIIGSKKEIISKSVGVFYLSRIDGGGGANGMWETYKKNGRWISDVSGISGGRREVDNIKLSRGDIKLLDSMEISVDNNLTVSFDVNGKAMFTIPYRENGMVYSVRNADNKNYKHEFHTWTTLVDENGNQLTHFSPYTAIVNERLYLFIKNDVDYSNIIKGNFECDSGDVVLVSYSIVDDTYEVDFFSSTDDGGTTLTFRRQQ